MTNTFAFYFCIELTENESNNQGTSIEYALYVMI